MYVYPGRTKKLALIAGAFGDLGDLTLPNFVRLGLGKKMIILGLLAY